jgi:hypothetical protein
MAARCSVGLSFGRCCKMRWGGNPAPLFVFV